ncbi:MULTISPECIES: hypothetical protein [unclassified Gordonia (in: high G+C Gram-positive bacteria)]|uniref:hypothetical protein n=2 Tax=Gordonia TaxID=2053 RepID=UPI000FB48F92|nr:hypothetical protein [Gordonia sp. UBA7599]RUP41563.1 MAG: hypothetical protein EKK60_00655 [Gordonia sp. (in: high G+C Gram-positive bacteria)]
MNPTLRRCMALAAVVVCGAMLTVGCSQSGGEESPTSSSSWVAPPPDPPITTTVPSPVPIEVNTVGLHSELAPGGTARWAADVNAGAVSTVIGKCWTVAPAYIRVRYFGDRSALAGIFLRRPVVGQAGVSWGRFDSTYAHIPWDEAKSDYPCPRITLERGEHLYSDAYVAYIAKRFILRAQGNPINPADTEAAYRLQCVYAPGEIRNVASGDVDQIDVTREDLPHGDARWTVRSGPLTMQMGIEPGAVCVKSAS